jgi:hypothetical protein
MKAGVYVDDCQFGKGVFAARDFAPREEILRFSGGLISLDAALAKGERESDPLQVGPTSYVDIGKPAVLVNHSCEPNAGLTSDLVLVALVRISAREQIFYDYSTTMDEDCWTLSCRCGTATCRGTVDDFKTLPDATRCRYLELGIVQPYIAQGYGAQELLPT